MSDAKDQNQSHPSTDPDELEKKSTNHLLRLIIKRLDVIEKMIEEGLR